MAFKDTHGTSIAITLLCDSYSSKGQLFTDHLFFFNIFKNKQMYFFCSGPPAVNIFSLVHSRHNTARILLTS